MRFLTIAIMAGALLAAGCVIDDYETPYQTYSNELSLPGGSGNGGGSGQGQFCGGIAGIQCPDGFECHLDGSYPDAGGTCERARPDHCATTLCAQVRCRAGFRNHTPPGRCCGMCIPDHEMNEGQCRTAADCSGLIHILCVGSWSCVQNTCEYHCDGVAL
jgi:hypothetical protein